MTSADRDALDATHRRLLERFRKVMNLVGPGPIGVHFDDCAAALDGVQATGAWVDLGSGAGFPGLVLAARCPEATVELVDSRQKRCAFLEQVVGESEASGVSVTCGRVEDLSSASYDGITARAFAAPDEVVSFARRLLRPGGRVVLFLQDDADLPDAPGFHVERENRYTVDGKRRRAVVLRQVAEPVVQTP